MFRNGASSRTMLSSALASFANSGTPSGNGAAFFF